MTSLAIKGLRAGCRVLPVAAVLAIGTSGPAVPQAVGGHWTIAAADGTTLLTGDEDSEQRQYPAMRGHPVFAGTTITTDEEGSAVLVRRGDVITIFANSVVTIPEESADEKLGVVQSMGKALFRMETRESRNFEVRTPFLAATIKGTTFTVDVETTRASVSVREGLVAVAATSGGVTEMVGPGWVATVEVDVPLIELAENRPIASPGATALAEPSSNGPATVGAGGPAPGNSGPGNSGPGNSGPGNSGPGNSGPGNSGPGNSGPGNSGPGNSGPGGGGPRGK